MAENQIITLYTSDELQLWEDYNSFPSYIKSSHQKILNTLCVMEECFLGSSNMLGRVFNNDRILRNVQARGSLGFVSRQFSMIKEFLLISLAIEYFAFVISCIAAVLMFGLTPSISALIKRITFDWGQLRNRNKPTVKAMRMGACIVIY